MNPRSPGASSAPGWLNTDTVDRPSDQARCCTAGPTWSGGAALTRAKPPGSSSGDGQLAALTCSPTGSPATAGRASGGRPAAGDRDVDERRPQHRAPGGVEHLAAQREPRVAVEPHPSGDAAVGPAGLDDPRGAPGAAARAHEGEVVAARQDRAAGGRRRWAREARRVVGSAEARLDLQAAGRVVSGRRARRTRARRPARCRPAGCPRTTAPGRPTRPAPAAAAPRSRRSARWSRPHRAGRRPRPGSHRAGPGRRPRRAGGRGGSRRAGPPAHRAPTEAVRTGPVSGREPVPAKSATKASLVGSTGGRAGGRDGPPSASTAPRPDDEDRAAEKGAAGLGAEQGCVRSTAARARAATRPGAAGARAARARRRRPGPAAADAPRARRRAAGPVAPIPRSRALSRRSSSTSARHAAHRARWPRARSRAAWSSSPSTRAGISVPR